MTSLRVRVLIDFLVDYQGDDENMGNNGKGAQL
jgi:hypothetical protein